MLKVREGFSTAELRLFLESSDSKSQSFRYGVRAFARTSQLFHPGPLSGYRAANRPGQKV